MRWSVTVPCLVFLTLLSGCVSIKFGREFASPDARTIVVGKTSADQVHIVFQDIEKSNWGHNGKLASDH